MIMINIVMGHSQSTYALKGGIEKAYESILGGRGGNKNRRILSVRTS